MITTAARAGVPFLLGGRRRDLRPQREAAAGLREGRQGVRARGPGDFAVRLSSGRKAAVSAIAVGTGHLADGLDRFERAMARLFREVRVRGWSGPSTRSRAATVCASSGIASAVLPAST